MTSARGIVGVVLFACALAVPARAAVTNAVTADGSVIGSASEVAGVSVFKGIPYAAPPLGELRWREPQASARWRAPLHADHFSPECIQTPAPPHSVFGKSTTAPQSEDCLYLNVWTPAKSANARLPVMVWIYGGGFNWGSASLAHYNGAHLAAKGVVLVSFNYRLASFGFLVHPALTAELPHRNSGNYGLLDMIAALKWVKANIAAFGGDPSRVTIFGELAGSCAVSALMASPLADGLFARAIGESTAQMDPAAGILGLQTYAQAEQAGLRFMRMAGAHSIAELRRMPAEQLNRIPLLYWITERDNYVLPNGVHDALAAGRGRGIDLMVGSNATEGSNLRVPWIKPATPAEKAAFAKLYPQAPTPATNTDVVLWQMYTWARLHANAGGRTYQYFFSRPTPLPLHTQFAEGASDTLGAFHGSEIAYVFGTLSAFPWNWNGADRALSDQMGTYWTNFARTGDPNGGGLPRWPAFHPAQPEVMILAPGPHAAPEPHKDALQFMDAYFDSRRSTEHQQ